MLVPVNLKLADNVVLLEMESLEHHLVQTDLDIVQQVRLKVGLNMKRSFALRKYKNNISKINSPD